MSLSLGDLELVKQVRDGDKSQLLEVRAVTSMDVACKRNIAELKIAGSSSNVLQDSGNEPVEIKITGRFLGKDAKKRVEQIRQMRSKGEPVQFASESISFAQIGKVMILRFDFQESLEAVNGVSYEMDLMEYR